MGGCQRACRTQTRCSSAANVSKFRQDPSGPFVAAEGYFTEGHTFGANRRNDQLSPEDKARPNGGWKRNGFSAMAGHRLSHREQ